jgi:hypothetical protein
MSLGTFYHWLDGGPREAILQGPTTDKSAVGISGEPTTGKPAVGGTTLYPPIARRRRVVGKRRRVLDADRISLAARLWRTAERQARDIEERLSRPSAATPERERDVRMLAMLVRTLRDLDGYTGPAEAPARPADGEPEGIDDMAQLRLELTRRLEAMQAERAARERAAEEGR